MTRLKAGASEFLFSHIWLPTAMPFLAKTPDSQMQQEATQARKWKDA